MFQGDSITDCGRSREANVPNTGLGGGYPFMAAAHLLCAKAEDGLKFFNRGISGNRIVDLYARWKIDGLNLNPDVISILIGVNDTWHAFGSNNGVEVPRFEQFYRMLLEWTVQARPGVKLVLENTRPDQKERREREYGIRLKLQTPKVDSTGYATKFTMTPNSHRT